MDYLKISIAVESCICLRKWVHIIGSGCSMIAAIQCGSTGLALWCNFWLR